MQELLEEPCAVDLIVIRRLRGIAGLFMGMWCYSGYCYGQLVWTGVAMDRDEAVSKCENLIKRLA